MAETHQVYLLMGSNIQPEQNIRAALRRLQDFMELQAISGVYQTPAVGSNGPDFLNLALRAVTPVDPAQLKLTVLRPVESELGRRRGPDKYAPRTMDLDLLIADKKVLEPALWLQAFIAIPLADLLPDLVQPQTGQALREIAAQLSQKVAVRRRTEFQPSVGLFGQLEL
jgi:2-amino-4-hydroxy-6-hydroxymethyldihydropteridine diphosphokinase